MMWDFAECYPFSGDAAGDYSVTSIICSTDIRTETGIYNLDKRNGFGNAHPLPDDSAHFFHRSSLL
jgi:hypothetical protein